MTKKTAFVLPEWIDAKTWKEYEKMRRAIKKPMTDLARKLGVNRLAFLRNQGFDVQEVLEQSIFNSWQGLFPVKDVASSPRSSEVRCGHGPSDDGSVRVKPEAYARAVQRAGGRGVQRPS